MTKDNSFKHFRTSRDIIRLAVMMYVRFPLSLRGQVFDFPPIGDKPPASSRSASASVLMIFSPEV
jgi:hypothetical protein